MKTGNHILFPAATPLFPGVSTRGVIRVAPRIGTGPEGAALILTTVRRTKDCTGIQGRPYSHPVRVAYTQELRTRQIGRPRRPSAESWTLTGSRVESLQKAKWKE